MRIRPVGDVAVLLEPDDPADVLPLYRQLRRSRWAGVIDVVPAAATVLLRIDPVVTSVHEVGRVAADLTPDPTETRGGDVVELSVVYDGPDLEEVGAITGLGPDGVVAAHTSTTWRVAFTGFAPGFGYLVSDGPALRVPRRDHPRRRVEPGAVGLADVFSGVYPRASPGGWQLIGRTDAAVWDLDREPPALLRPGTSVRFVMRS